ncbi:MAG: extracellular solute-binding protein [Oscillibacter sp.]|nr:extracellular solute-binding protein [Oscillibacter sp.]
MRRICAVVLLSAAVLCAVCARRDGVTIRIGVYSGSYWQTPNGDCYQILDNAIRRFESAHERVKVEYVSGITTDSYSEWLSEQILSGTEPDLYFVLPEDFNLLVTCGALAKLDAFMDADAAFDASLYYEPSLRSGTFEGGQYALPHESVPTIMFVNKTLLERNGIPVPRNDWTWRDFYDICQRVTNVEARQFGAYDYTWLHALYSNGTSLFSEDGTACYLSDEKIRSAIQFVKSLRDLNGGYQVTARDFDLGNVAFRPFLFSEYRAYQPYPWRVKKYSGFQWDCISMPAGPYGDNVSELHTMLLGISARTRHEALAWELCKLLSLDEEVQRELYADSSGISPLRAVQADAPESDRLGLEAIDKIMSTAVSAPRFDGYEQALMMAENAVADEMALDITRGDGLTAAQREINVFLGKS